MISGLHLSRAIVAALYAREIPAPVIAEIVACVVQCYPGNPHLARNVLDLLTLHARRSGRKRDKTRTQRIANATAWAIFNGRTDKAIAQAAQRFDVRITEIERAFSKRDSTITRLVHEVIKSPEKILGTSS